MVRCLLLAVALASSATSLWGATYCEQRFLFLGRTVGDAPIFWIIETVSGECEQTRLLQVSVPGNQGRLLVTEFSPDADPQRLIDGFAALRHETPLQLVVDKTGAWRPPGADWRVTAPAQHEGLWADFEQFVHEGGSSAAAWNAARKDDGALLPVLHDIPATLVYAYPQGLYVNYDIAAAFYFARSGHLLIFTHQAERAPGYDTMHGFFILRRAE